jgi:hypothetical protein
MAIVAPPHTMYSWRKEVQLVMPEWNVLYVQDARSLKGLAKKLAQLHLVVFSRNLFTTNKAVLKSLFSSSLQEDRPWTEDHQVLWTTLWHTVVIDEVHTLLQDRQAILLRTLVSGHQHILVTATPQLEDSQSIDTYAYLLGITQNGQNIYPATPTLQDHLHSESVKVSRYTTGVTRSPYFTLPEETRRKVHYLFLRHCVINTGAQLEVEIHRETHIFRESAQFSRFPAWQREMTQQLSSSTLVPFAIQCRNYVDGIRRDYPDHYVKLHYDKIRLAIDEDLEDQTNLGTIVGGLLNNVPVHLGLTPIQMAVVRILVSLLSIDRTKIIIYSEPMLHYLWQNTTKVLQVSHGIKVVHFNGTVQSLDKKLQRMERNQTGTKTVMFLPDNHLDGTNFDFVTHVLIVGKAKNEANYLQFLGRATRMGRETPLTVIEMTPDR